MGCTETAQVGQTASSRGDLAPGRAIPGEGVLLLVQGWRALDVARRAHPGLHVDSTAFFHFLSRRRPVVDGAGVPTHVADLYLVAAALEGRNPALELLDARLRALLPRALRRLRPDDELRAEVLQRTRERLLVGPRMPKLAEYQGRGGLDPFLRSVLVRVALNLLEARPQGEEEMRGLAELAAPGPDPELSLLRRSEQATIQAALVEALATLEPRTRHFLALYVLEGLTLEEIGRRVGTHKSTVSRALSAARARVMSALRRRFRGIEGDLDSLIGVLGETGADLPWVLRELLNGIDGS
jgi:RNA polymerase sigma-70 factor, ECF subfamily